MKKTKLFIIFTVLIFSTACGVKVKKKSDRIPASVPSQTSDVDQFFSDIENAPSSKY